MQKKAFNVILIDPVYRKDENYYPKMFLEKYNFYDSYNVDFDEEYFDNFDNSYEKILTKKIQMKKIPTKKIQMKKIKCINLFLEKASDLISIHPEMLENFVKKYKIFLFSRL